MNNLLLILLAIPALQFIWWAYKYPHQTLNYLTYRPYMTAEGFEVMIKHWLYLLGTVGFLCTLVYKTL